MQSLCAYFGYNLEGVKRTQNRTMASSTAATLSRQSGVPKLDENLWNGFLISLTAKVCHNNSNNDLDVNNSDDDENVVVLSSDSESESETEAIWSNNLKAKGFKRLWTQARQLIFHRLAVYYPKLNNGPARNAKRTTSNALAMVEEPQLAPSARLKELYKELVQFQHLHKLNDSELEHLWNSVLHWLIAIKNSPDPLDRNYDEKYNLILVDFMVEYMNYVCKLYHSDVFLTGTGGSRLAIMQEKTDQLMQTLSIIFNGNNMHSLMVLLRIDLKMEHRDLWVPIFRKHLTDVRLRDVSNDLALYLRIIFCFKRWKIITPLKTDRELINEIAVGKSMTQSKRQQTTDGSVAGSSEQLGAILPRMVPQVNEQNQLFLAISDLIGFAIQRKAIGTRILLVYTSLDLDVAINKYFYLYEKYIARKLRNNDSPLPLSAVSPITMNSDNYYRVRSVVPQTSNLQRSSIQRQRTEVIPDDIVRISGGIPPTCDITTNRLSTNTNLRNDSCKVISDKTQTLSLSCSVRKPGKNNHANAANDDIVIHLDSSGDENESNNHRDINLTQAASHNTFTSRSQDLSDDIHPTLPRHTSQILPATKENNSGLIVCLSSNSEDEDETSRCEKTSSSSSVQHQIATREALADCALQESGNTQMECGMMPPPSTTPTPISVMRNHRETNEMDMSVGENLLSEPLLPRLHRTIIENRSIKPLRKEKHCIPGEVSSTTSLDNMCEEQCVVASGITSSSLIETTRINDLANNTNAKNDTTTVSPSESVDHSLEVHSAGSCFQRAREVGTLKAVLEEHPALSPRPGVIGCNAGPHLRLQMNYDDDFLLEKDDGNDDIKGRKCLPRTRDYCKVVEEATSSTEVFQRTQVTENIVFSMSSIMIDGKLRNVSSKGLSDLKLSATSSEKPTCSRYLSNLPADEPTNHKEPELLHSVVSQYNTQNKIARPDESLSINSIGKSGISSIAESQLCQNESAQVMPHSRAEAGVIACAKLKHSNDWRSMDFDRATPLENPTCLKYLTQDTLDIQNTVLLQIGESQCSAQNKIVQLNDSLNINIDNKPSTVAKQLPKKISQQLRKEFFSYKSSEFLESKRYEIAFATEKPDVICEKSEIPLNVAVQIPQKESMLSISNRKGTVTLEGTEVIQCAKSKPASDSIVQDLDKTTLSEKPKCSQHLTNISANEIIRKELPEIVELRHEKRDNGVMLNESLCINNSSSADVIVATQLPSIESVQLTPKEKVTESKNVQVIENTKSAKAESSAAEVNMDRATLAKKLTNEVSNHQQSELSQIVAPTEKRNDILLLNKTPYIKSNENAAPLLKIDTKKQLMLEEIPTETLKQTEVVGCAQSKFASKLSEVSLDKAEKTTPPRKNPSDKGHEDEANKHSIDEVLKALSLVRREEVLTCDVLAKVPKKSSKIIQGSSYCINASQKSAKASLNTNDIEQHQNYLNTEKTSKSVELVMGTLMENDLQQAKVPDERKAQKLEKTVQSLKDAISNSKDKTEPGKCYKRLSHEFKNDQQISLKCTLGDATEQILVNTDRVSDLSKILQLSSEYQCKEEFTKSGMNDMKDDLKNSSSIDKNGSEVNSPQQNINSMLDIASVKKIPCTHVIENIDPEKVNTKNAIELPSKNTGACLNIESSLLSEVATSADIPNHASENYESTIVLPKHSPILGKLSPNKDFNMDNSKHVEKLCESKDNMKKIDCSIVVNDILVNQSLLENKLLQGKFDKSQGDNGDQPCIDSAGKKTLASPNVQLGQLSDSHAAIMDDALKNEKPPIHAIDKMYTDVEKVNNANDSSFEVFIGDSHETQLRNTSDLTDVIQKEPTTLETNGDCGTVNVDCSGELSQLSLNRQIDEISLNSKRIDNSLKSILVESTGTINKLDLDATRLENVNESLSEISIDNSQRVNSLSGSNENRAKVGNNRICANDTVSKSAVPLIDELADPVPRENMENTQTPPKMTSRSGSTENRAKVGNNRISANDTVSKNTIPLIDGLADSVPCENIENTQTPPVLCKAVTEAEVKIIEKLGKESILVMHENTDSKQRDEPDNTENASNFTIKVEENIEKEVDSKSSTSTEQISNLEDLISVRLVEKKINDEDTTLNEVTTKQDEQHRGRRKKVKTTKLTILNDNNSEDVVPTSSEQQSEIQNVASSEVPPVVGNSDNFVHTQMSLNYNSEELLAVTALVNMQSKFNTSNNESVSILKKHNLIPSSLPVKKRVLFDEENLRSLEKELDMSNKLKSNPKSSCRKNNIDKSKNAINSHTPIMVVGSVLNSTLNEHHVDNTGNVINFDFVNCDIQKPVRTYHTSPTVNSLNHKLSKSLTKNDINTPVDQFTSVKVEADLLQSTSLHRFSKRAVVRVKRLNHAKCSVPNNNSLPISENSIPDNNTNLSNDIAKNEERNVKKETGLEKEEMDKIKCEIKTEDVQINSSNITKNDRTSQVSTGTRRRAIILRPCDVLLPTQLLHSYARPAVSSIPPKPIKSIPRSNIQTRKKKGKLLSQPDVARQNLVDQINSKDSANLIQEATTLLPTVITCIPSSTITNSVPKEIKESEKESLKQLNFANSNNTTTEFIAKSVLNDTTKKRKSKIITQPEKTQQKDVVKTVETSIVSETMLSNNKRLSSIKLVQQAVKTPSSVQKQINESKKTNLKQNDTENASKTLREVIITSIVSGTTETKKFKIIAQPQAIRPKDLVETKEVVSLGSETILPNNDKSPVTKIVRDTINAETIGTTCNHVSSLVHLDSPKIDPDEILSKCGQDNSKNISSDVIPLSTSDAAKLNNSTEISIVSIDSVNSKQHATHSASNEIIESSEKESLNQFNHENSKHIKAISALTLSSVTKKRKAKIISQSEVTRQKTLDENAETSIMDGVLLPNICIDSVKLMQNRTTNLETVPTAITSSSATHSVRKKIHESEELFDYHNSNNTPILCDFSIKEEVANATQPDPNQQQDLNERNVTPSPIEIILPDNCIGSVIATDHDATNSPICNPVFVTPSIPKEIDESRNTSLKEKDYESSSKASTEVITTLTVSDAIKHGNTSNILQSDGTQLAETPVISDTILPQNCTYVDSKKMNESEECCLEQIDYQNSNNGIIEVAKKAIEIDLIKTENIQIVAQPTAIQQENLDETTQELSVNSTLLTSNCIDSVTPIEYGPANSESVIAISNPSSAVKDLQDRCLKQMDTKNVPTEVIATSIVIDAIKKRKCVDKSQNIHATKQQHLSECTKTPIISEMILPSNSSNSVRSIENVFTNSSVIKADIPSSVPQTVSKDSSESKKARLIQMNYSNNIVTKVVVTPIVTDHRATNKSQLVAQPDACRLQVLNLNETNMNAVDSDTTLSNKSLGSDPKKEHCTTISDPIILTSDSPPDTHLRETENQDEVSSVRHDLSDTQSVSKEIGDSEYTCSPQMDFENFDDNITEVVVTSVDTEAILPQDCITLSSVTEHDTTKATCSALEESEELQGPKNNITEVIAELKLLSPENFMSSSSSPIHYIAKDHHHVSEIGKCNVTSSERKYDRELKTRELLDSAIEQVLGEKAITTHEQLDISINAVLGNRCKDDKDQIDLPVNEKESSTKQYINKTKNRFEISQETEISRNVKTTVDTKIDAQQKEITPNSSSASTRNYAKKTLKKSALNDVKIISAKVPDALFADDDSDNSNGEEVPNDLFFKQPVLYLDDFLSTKKDALIMQNTDDIIAETDTNQHSASDLISTQSLITPNKDSSGLEEQSTYLVDVNTTQSVTTPNSSNIGTAVHLPTNLEVSVPSFTLTDIPLDLIPPIAHNDTIAVPVINGKSNTSNNNHKEYTYAFDALQTNQFRQSADCMISGNYSSPASASVSSKHADIIVGACDNVANICDDVLPGHIEAKKENNTATDLDLEPLTDDTLWVDELFSFPELGAIQSRSNSFSSTQNASDISINSPLPPSMTDDDNFECENSQHSTTAIKCDHTYNKAIVSSTEKTQSVKPKNAGVVVENSKETTVSPSSSNHQHLIIKKASKPNEITTTSNKQVATSTSCKEAESPGGMKLKSHPIPYWKSRKSDVAKRRLSGFFDECPSPLKIQCQTSESEQTYDPMSKSTENGTKNGLLSKSANSIFNMPELGSLSPVIVSKKPEAIEKPLVPLTTTNSSNCKQSSSSTATDRGGMHSMKTISTASPLLQNSMLEIDISASTSTQPIIRIQSTTNRLQIIDQPDISKSDKPNTSNPKIAEKTESTLLSRESIPTLHEPWKENNTDKLESSIQDANYDIASSINKHDETVLESSIVPTRTQARVKVMSADQIFDALKAEESFHKTNKCLDSLDKKQAILDQLLSSPHESKEINSNQESSSSSEFSESSQSSVQSDDEISTSKPTAMVPEENISTVRSIKIITNPVTNTEAKQRKMISSYKINDCLFVKSMKRSANDIANDSENPPNKIRVFKHFNAITPNVKLQCEESELNVFPFQSKVKLANNPRVNCCPESDSDINKQIERTNDMVLRSRSQPRTYQNRAKVTSKQNQGEITPLALTSSPTCGIVDTPPSTHFAQQQQQQQQQQQHQQQHQQQQQQQQQQQHRSYPYTRKASTPMDKTNRVVHRTNPIDQKPNIVTSPSPSASLASTAANHSIITLPIVATKTSGDLNKINSPNTLTAKQTPLQTQLPFVGTPTADLPRTEFFERRLTPASESAIELELELFRATIPPSNTYRGHRENKQRIQEKEERLRNKYMELERRNEAQRALLMEHHQNTVNDQPVPHQPFVNTRSHSLNMQHTSLQFNRPQLHSYQKSEQQQQQQQQQQQLQSQLQQKTQQQYHRPRYVNKFGDLEKRIAANNAACTSSQNKMGTHTSRNKPLAFVKPLTAQSAWVPKKASADEIIEELLKKRKKNP